MGTWWSLKGVLYPSGGLRRTKQDLKCVGSKNCTMLATPGDPSHQQNCPFKSMTLAFIGKGQHSITFDGPLAVPQKCPSPIRGAQKDQTGLEMCQFQKLHNFSNARGLLSSAELSLQIYDFSLYREGATFKNV